MTDLIVALRSELQSLEAALAADPRYRKLEKISRVARDLRFRKPAKIAGCSGYIYTCTYKHHRLGHQS